MADLNEWLSVDYPNGGGSTIVNLTIQPNYDGDRTQRLKIQGLKKTVFVDVEQSVANTEEIDREYFYIHFEEPNGIFYIQTYNTDWGNELDIDYSFDGVNWVNKKVVKRQQFALGDNKKIYLRNNTKSLSYNNVRYILYLIDRAKVGGNILSLSDMKTGAFAHLFYNNTKLTDASNLILPDYVEMNCYLDLFRGCTNLQYPPQLPATTLAYGCYSYMFYNCTNLQYTPELPATELAENCYNEMFSGCSSLINAPQLPVTELAVDCYNGMFANCTSLINAPQLPATTLTDGCYFQMFANCTSLINAPELPATTLANSCYSYMFMYCTSLINAPELPATTLTKLCYSGMFMDCTSLINAPELPATTLTDYCYEIMFSGCTSLINAPELPATTLAEYCYKSMFNGCTSLINAPELPATTLTYYCYKSMFEGCTSLVNAPELPAIKIGSSCYNYMFKDCINLQYIKILTEKQDLVQYECFGWTQNVSPTGTFVKKKGVTFLTGVSGIPDGWEVIEID